MIGQSPDATDAGGDLVSAGCADSDDPQPRAGDADSSSSPDDGQGADDSPMASDLALPVAGPRELGGRDGLEPTRYGDWEKNGRCIDF